MLIENHGNDPSSLPWLDQFENIPELALLELLLELLLVELLVSISPVFVHATELPIISFKNDPKMTLDYTGISSLVDILKRYFKNGDF